MKTTLLILLLLATSARADLLSQIQMESSGNDIAFGIFAVGGLGEVFHQYDSTAGVPYQVPANSVAFMFEMVLHPTKYQAHGPVRALVGFGDAEWQDYYSNIGFTHYDEGPGSPVSIEATHDVFAIPWQSVILSRSNSLLTVSIYDTPVPEPTSAAMLGEVLLALVYSWPRRVKCVHCGATVEAPFELAGKLARCGKCLGVVTMPRRRRGKFANPPGAFPMGKR